MGKSIIGTETEKNLLKSFAGESQARNRYTFWASVAKKEGLRQISEIFTETAAQEQEHAKRMFKFLESGEAVEITAMYPAGKIGTSTLEHLEMAAGGEEEEWQEIYPSMAATAEAEGFPAIAKMYQSICVAEKLHGDRYRKLAATLKSGESFKKDGKVTWYCMNCGYLHEGEEAPKVCPACLHKQAHFSLLADNY